MTARLTSSISRSIAAFAVVLWTVTEGGRLIAAGPEPSIVLERSELRFATVMVDAVPKLTTPEQVVLIEANGADKVPFTASSNQQWLTVRPTNGFAPGRLVVGVHGAPIRGPAGSVTGEITLAFGSDSAASRQVLHVSLAMLANESRPPFGYIDSADEIALGDRPVVLQGWALDDIAITDVEICRNETANVETGRACGKDSAAFIGKATFAYGTRPDVLKAYPRTPLNFRSGWWHVLERKTIAHGRQGPFEIHAVARDAEGHSTVLRKSIVVRLETPAPTPIPFPILTLVLSVGCFALAQLWFRERLRHAAPTRCDDRFIVAASARWEWLFLGTAIVGFVALELRAMTKGLQYDELYTASHFVVGRSLWQAASTVGVFNNHIAYSLLAGLATRLFGTAEWVLRMPSVVCGAITIVVVWIMTRLNSNRVVALMAAGLLAISPLFVTLAHMGRGYAGLTLMCLISTYCFFVLLRRPSIGAAWCHGTANILAVYFNLYGIWIVVVQYLVFVSLVLRSNNASSNDCGPVGPAALRLLWNSFSAAAIALILLYLPVIDELTQVFISRGRTPLKANFPAELYGAFLATNSIALRLSVTGVALLGLLRLRRIEVAYFVLLLGLPLFVMWALVRPFDLYTRFFVFWTPMFACLLANGIACLGAWVSSRTGALTRTIAFASAVAGCIVVGLLTIDWMRQDLENSPGGYGDLLRSAVHEQGWQTFAVGADSEMFEYYLPKPFGVLHNEAELDRVIHESPRLQVAYHNVGWNSADQRQIAEALRRRCAVEDHGVVVMFRCDP